MNNISKGITNCFGCNACLNICPQKAITLDYNTEGFLYPTVNKDKCTNCGLCRKACPDLTNLKKNAEKPVCYAFMANDEIRYNSSSGGVFPVLAKHFIDNGGFVTGAVWNEDATVSHIVSDKPEDIEKMRSSKYLQSNIGNCYSEVKKLLLENKQVLFTGTPCQIAGLKSFLQKDYDNLYYVDIICHGTPSPKVFQKYIRENFSLEKEKWLNTNFRDKCNGWIPQLTTTTTTTRTVSKPASDDNYMKAFLRNLCLRESCTSCKFQTIPRQGDMTMGDFWGIRKFSKKIDDKKGLSVVLVNNTKGEYLLNILKNNAKLIKPVPLKYAIKGNPCLVKPVIKHKNRKLFFELYNEKNMQELNDICLENKTDYLIINFWDSKFNYGAMLTAFAIQEMIKNFGFFPRLMNLAERTTQKWYKDSHMEDFANKYLNITEKLETFNKCKETAEKCKGVIIGSDQVLRLGYIVNNINKYMLNFVGNNTKKIALSASFGINKEEYLSCVNFTPKIKEYMKNALQSFDYLSCRELSGKDIFKDVFSLESDMILDPVFLVDKTKYENIVKNAKGDYSNKIVSYVLDETEKHQDLYKNIKQKINAEFVKIDVTKWYTEEWLKSIKDCKFLITDSFHGTCFALIFNKPFICFRNKDRGDTRFETLIELFDIKDNFAYSVDEILNSDKDFSINYQLVNELINTKKKTDLEIIEKVLKEDFSNNLSAKANKIKNEKYLNELKKHSNSIMIINGLKSSLYGFLANFTSKTLKKELRDKKCIMKSERNIYDFK